MISMLYLPFNDPDASYKIVQEFGDKKGVVGFLVTSARYKPVHDNDYMKTYALLEEMGKPLALPRRLQLARPDAWSMINRFISVHALGFTFTTCCT